MDNAQREETTSPPKEAPTNKNNKTNKHIYYKL
jgi:hypothetical protein